MKQTVWRPRRRQVLTGGAAAAAGLVLPGKAPAAGGKKPLSGVTLNVSCWGAPYPLYLHGYIPEFEEMTGAKVNYTTPSFPIYNQRIDLELSTQSGSYDVLNITFIYAGRWIGAGWFTPLDAYLHDKNKTPAGWDPADFIAGATAAFKYQGKQYGVPWIADILMAGCSRYDLFQKAGAKLPDTFSEMRPAFKAINKMDGVPAFIAENHYGWNWIPYLMGFGGKVFRNPPHDLMPMLDTPESIQAADFYAGLLRDYGPNGVVSDTYDQVVVELKNGQANYSTNNEDFLVQMGAADSKVRDTCNFSLYPAGPKGRFPGVASHAWGIPTGAKNKDAAWQFIVWAMSKQMIERMVKHKNYTSITRRSIIDSPYFKKNMTINGHELAGIYLKTLELAATGYMTYRTVDVYPQVDHQIDIAISAIASGQMSAKAAMQQAQQRSIAQLRRGGVRL